MVHVFNPNTQEAEVGGRSCEFKASLVYKASSIAARATQKNTGSKHKQNKNRKEKEKREFSIHYLAIINCHIHCNFKSVSLN